MTNTPPEVLEKWGEDFTKWIDSQFWGECIQGKERAEFLKVWNASRQTAIIELPSRGNGYPTGKIEVAQAAEYIESQGYRVEMKS